MREVKPPSATSRSSRSITGSEPKAWRRPLTSIVDGSNVTARTSRLERHGSIVTARSSTVGRQEVVGERSRRVDRLLEDLLVVEPGGEGRPDGGVLEAPAPRRGGVA